MINRAIARRYAQALFEIADQRNLLDRIESELQEFNDLLVKNQEMRDVLNHPYIDDKDKKLIIQKVCPSYSGITLNFIYLIIDRRRQSLLDLIGQEFSAKTDKAKNIIEAKIISAAELDPKQTEQISRILAGKTGGNIRLVSVVDPELIGGLKIQIGDMVMDGTVRTALDKMHRHLKKAPASASAGSRGEIGK